MATVSDLFVRVRADVSGLQRGMATSAASVKAFGVAASGSAATTTRAAESATTKLTGLGRAFGGQLGGILGIAKANFGLAAVAAGAVAVKMTLDFENAFTRIGAISNASTADIARWKDEVLTLSGATAQAPTDLADALFFLSSAGLAAAQIMPTLEASAKAAATGLGTTTDVANITASALNAYSKSGLTAAQVTDTLVAAVREGRAEPEEFAGALGRILPIASQAGVTFQDVTASLAGLSNVGLDVDEAVTAMRGTLQAIVAPGSAAAAAMGSLGLSAQDLLDAISERGLIGALRLLDDRAKQTSETQADYIGVLRKIVPNVRALTGVLGLTGQAAAKVDAIFKNVTNSTGALDDAFLETTQGPGFVFKQLFNDSKVALIRFGEAVLPIATTLAKVLAPGLRLAGRNAEFLLNVLLGYAAIKFLPGLIGQIALSLANVGAVAGTGGAAGALAAVAVSLGSIATANPVGLALGIGALFSALEPIQQVDPVGDLHLEDLRTDLLAANPLLSSVIDNVTLLVHQVQLAGSNIDALSPQGLEDLRAGIVKLNSGFAEAGSSIRLTMQDFLILAGGSTLPQFTQVVEDISTAFEQTSTSGKTLNSVLASAGPVYTALGQDASSFRDDVREALSKVSDEFKAGKSATAAYAAFTQDKLQKAAAAFAAWRSSAETNLNFVAAKFSEVATDFKGSAEDIARALKASFADQKTFARDLDRILADGTQGSKLLVQQLIALGPAGAAAAHSIAGGSDAVRASIESTLRKSQQFAADTAAELQSQILGTLEDIRDFFVHDLQPAFEVALGIDLNTDGVIGAVDKVQGLRDVLRTTAATRYQLRVAAQTKAANDAIHATEGNVRNLTVPLWKLDIGYDTVDTANTRVGGLSRSLLGVSRHEWRVLVNLGGNALSTLATINSGLNNLPEERSVDLYIRTHRTIVKHGGGPVLHAGGFVPAVAASTSRVAPRMHVGGLKADEVPAVLQRGEYVIRRQSVERIGAPVLDALNRLHSGGAAVPLAAAAASAAPQVYHVGGPVSTVTRIIERHEGGAIARVLHEGGNVQTMEPVAPTVKGLRTMNGGGSDVRVRVDVDRKRFGRDLDYDQIANGR